MRKWEREKERYRCRIFLKGMTGALAPLSYLVLHILKMEQHILRVIIEGTSEKVSQF